MDGAEWSRATRRASDLAGRLAQVQADLVALTAELLDSGGWAGDGVRSPEHWLQVYTGLSASQCRQIVRVAERGDELGPVTSAMTAGRLTLDQAAVVASKVPQWAVEAVGRLAEATTVTQLRRAVAQYPFEREQPPHEEPVPPPERQPATVSMTTVNGRFHLRFVTDAVEGALVEQAIREAKDALFVSGRSSATLADGLVEVACRSLAAVECASRRDHYKVMLHLSTDGSGWLERKGAVPPSLLQSLTCQGGVRPVWESDGVPVSVGRSQRILPERTRRLVEDRDKGCRYPGCSATGFLENHHLVHWNDGGATDMDNLVSLCSHHHRSHHQEEFSMVGDPNRPDGLEFVNRWGLRIGRRLQELAPEQSEAPPPDRANVRGERLVLGQCGSACRLRWSRAGMIRRRNSQLTPSSSCAGHADGPPVDERRRHLSVSRGTVGDCSHRP